MIKHAYTARELAELQLDGWPQTLRAFQIRAQREGWPSRPRQASGGGFEFPFATLPAELQNAIITKAGAGNSEMFAPLAGLTEAAPTIGAEERRLAKVTIVNMFRKYCREYALSMAKAEPGFLVLYRQQAATTPDKMPYSIYADFSIVSLRRWRVTAERDYKRLCGDYGKRKGTSVINRAADGEMDKYVAALVTENRHYTAYHIRDLCIAKFGGELTVEVPSTKEKKVVPMPSERAFARHIAQWKEDNAAVFTAITAPGEYKNKLRMATGTASEYVSGLNEYWEIDASPADALCVDGRYNIYAIIDVWSRRTLFSVSKTAKTDASLLLVRRAIMEWGVPQVLKTDNGSDFVSYRFKTALMALGIEQEISPPFSPEKKPYVERVIGTMQRDLMAILPGFGGHNVADRQRIRDQKDFAARLGEKEDKTFSVELTAEQLQDMMNQWAADKYGNRVHSTIGVTPNEKAASWPHPVKKPKDERALDLLLAPIAGGNAGRRTITKQGIAVDGYRYTGTGLIPIIGDTVLVRHDPADMGRVLVFDENENFLCDAVCPELSGIDRQQHAAEMKAAQTALMAEEKKQINKMRRNLNRLADAKTILEQHKPQVVTQFPCPAEEHSTPALESASKAMTATPSEPRSAEETRKIAELAERMKAAATPVDEKENDRARWIARAKDIEARQAAGNTVSPSEELWINKMRQMHWYKAWKGEEARLAEALANARQKETPGVGPDVS